MTPIAALTPAPGRTIYPLDGGWTAVFLEPVAGHPYRALGFFLDGELSAETDDPAVVRGFLRAVAQHVGRR